MKFERIGNRLSIEFSETIDTNAALKGHVGPQHSLLPVSIIMIINDLGPNNKVTARSTTECKLGVSDN